MCGRRKECPLRLVVCPACDLTLPANRLRTHRRKYCEATAALLADKRAVRAKLEEKLEAARRYPRPWTQHMAPLDDLSDDDEDHSHQHGQKKKEKGVKVKGGHGRQ